MKAKLILTIFLGAVLLLSGCAKVPEVVNTIDGNFKTYYEMSDGTWQENGRSYQYRLEVNGKAENAASDATFVYLSNVEDISFEQAWKSFWSSSSYDFMRAEDAVLVELY